MVDDVERILNALIKFDGMAYLLGLLTGVAATAFIAVMIALFNMESYSGSINDCKTYQHRDRTYIEASEECLPVIQSLINVKK